jgi:dual specificity tyrosine-phosphorylation-regulated kinase 2/3/4
VLKTTDDDFVDFLMRCFTWDASSRLKPNEALNHPWLQSVIPKNNFDKFKTKITKETETNFF